MPASEAALIQDFLAAGPWAVVGASTDRSKYGNKVLRCYQQAGKSPVYPVHPKEREIEGLAAYPSLTALPERPRAQFHPSLEPADHAAFNQAIDHAAVQC